MYILLLIQALVGFTQYYTPSVYGGMDNAKKIWKWHRASGYVVLVLGLATVCAATQTDFNKKVLGMELWAVVVASVLVVLGVGSRVKLQKLGLKK
jgi:cytochrome b561